MPEIEAAGAPAAQDLAIEVVYEDADLIVVNKPRGWSCTPRPATPTARW